VGPRQRVRTAAGTFDAYVIDWAEDGREGNPWHVEHQFWFAPSVGYFVKFVADKRTDMQDWEATRVIVPERDTAIAAAARESTGSSMPPPPGHGLTAGE